MTSERIDAVISDFGGVLTSPMTESFVGVLDSSGVSLEELGKAMMAIAERDGSNPLAEVETGRVSVATFLGRISDQLSAQVGSQVELDGFGERYFRHLKPNQRLIDYMRGLRDRGYKMAICTNNIREWEQLWRGMLPVEEIFDVQLLPGLRFPELIGFQKEAIHHTFVVPPCSPTFGCGQEATAHGNKFGGALALK